MLHFHSTLALALTVTECLSLRSDEVDMHEQHSVPDDDEHPVKDEKVNCEEQRQQAILVRGHQMTTKIAIGTRSGRYLMKKGVA